MHLKNIFIVLSITFWLSACTGKKADLLVYNAKIYTVDSLFTTMEAMAIKDGKIVATGSPSSLSARYSFAEKLNAEGKFIYPGFIDAHAHFVGYALNLLRVNLVGTKSWEEILYKIQEFAKENPTGWILGEGWDQNDWADKKYPNPAPLNNLFPDRPVLLTRVDGHAAIANQHALQQAGIKGGETMTGGEVLVEGGEPTGVLIDNAVELVNKIIPPISEAAFKKAIKKAQENCLAVGLTTIDDCGLEASVVEQLKKLQKNGSLLIRLYVMLSDKEANYAYAEKNGILITDRLTVRSIKVYGDGALGSRGACLLEEYSDRAGHLGFLLSIPGHFDSVANWCAKNGWQMNTHAIGDSGNRTILTTYARYLKSGDNKRWRIEHAQVVNPADINFFGQYQIIPSVQPTHATSDMYWAEERLGNERISQAYAYQSLLKQNGWIPLGTDFPVEDISPFKTFYAAVTRTDSKGWPSNGFQIKEALSRQEALKGMTIWAARANFEELKKGSLEKGKWADFVILEKDLMHINPVDILNTRVISTFINGEKVYSSQK
ncbi:MAG: amidohydrolase [Bacteroidetes bacterium]|nr:amidohydrolase [Bacteroidota bacterium]